MPSTSPQPAKKRASTLTERQAARARGYSVIPYKGDRWEARVVVPAPEKPTGKREVSKVTDTEQAAHDWAQSVRASVKAGTFLPTATDTFNALADDWLQWKTDKGVREVTLIGYRRALKPARDALGPRRVQTIDYVAVEALLRSQKHRGTATNIKLIGYVRAIFERAMKKHRLIDRNPCDGLEVIGAKPTKPGALAAEDWRRVKQHIVGDRLEAAWLATLIGLRRSEVLALRWSDLGPDCALLTVRGGRTDTGAASLAITDPKTGRGARTLPLPDDIAAGMRRCRAIRQQEHLRLGAPWSDDNLIAVDGALRPVSPSGYSSRWLVKRDGEWRGLVVDAGCEGRVSLHAARRGSVSLMLANGASPYAVASWHGHDASLSLGTYNRTSQATLAQVGQALG